MKLILSIIVFCLHSILFSQQIEELNRILKIDSLKLHENEIRICHKPFVDPSSMQHFVLDSMFEGKPWNGFEIKPFALKINPLELIEEIIISPYTKEAFTSSVVDICKKYNIPENKVRKSNLLDDYKKMIFDSN